MTPDFEVFPDSETSKWWMTPESSNGWRWLQESAGDAEIQFTRRGFGSRLVDERVVNEAVTAGFSMQGVMFDGR